jgi:CheY-like chemotaxis protein
VKVLVVEDNRVSARVVEAILQKEGHEVLLARSGSHALVFLECVPDIGLVVADIMMPEMDGLELLRRINENPNWRNIPVIMCTALAHASSVKKAIELGCKHYVVKPIQPEHFLRAIHEALGGEAPVLRGMSDTVARFGLDPLFYKETAEAFACQVYDAIHLLRSLQESREPDRAAPLPERLSKLAEGAALLGADRVARALEHIPANTSMDADTLSLTYRSELAELMKELQTLHSALTDELKSLRAILSKSASVR